MISFPLVTTTPDEQSQVFMVLEEDVSKSVVSGPVNTHTCTYMLVLVLRKLVRTYIY